MNIVRPGLRLPLRKQRTSMVSPKLRVRLQKTPATECPHLGLATDPFARHPGASDEHRCYAQLVRERVDMGHQRRFCLASAHGSCPFLLLSPNAPRRGWLVQARAGWRNVSPARPALTAAQLGHSAELAVAAAGVIAPLALAVLGITV